MQTCSTKPWVKRKKEEEAQLATPGGEGRLASVAQVAQAPRDRHTRVGPGSSTVLPKPKLTRRQRYEQKLRKQHEAAEQRLATSHRTLFVANVPIGTPGRGPTHLKALASSQPPPPLFNPPRVYGIWFGWSADEGCASKNCW